MNPKFYDTEYNNFQVTWRKRYIEALEMKFEAIKETVVGINRSYETATLEIEALEIENKIRHEKIVYADWVLRAEQYKTFQANEQSEAEENMQRVLDTANGFLQSLKDQKKRAVDSVESLLERSLTTKIDRIENLLSKYEGANKSDADEMVKIYQSLKTALLQMGVKWDHEKKL